MIEVNIKKCEPTQPIEVNTVDELVTEVDKSIRRLVNIDCFNVWTKSEIDCEGCPYILEDGKCLIGTIEDVTMNYLIKKIIKKKGK